jgi:outer membrane protein assembly factor BamB
LIEMQLPQRASRTVILLVACFAAEHLAAADWPRLRGPNGLGIAENGVLPSDIGPAINVVWKTALPSGKSCPVVTADRIYFIGHENGKLSTLASERATSRSSGDERRPGIGVKSGTRSTMPPRPLRLPTETTYTSFSPVMDSISYDRDGNERWRVPLGPFSNFHGMAASPVLALETAPASAAPISDEIVSSI